MENEISPNELDVKLSEKARRRAVKGDTNFTVGGLLIYLVIFLGVEVADMIIRMIGMIIKAGGDPDVQDIIDETVDYYLTHAGCLIVGVILGVAFMFLFFRNRVKPAELFRSRGKMTPKTFFVLLCVFMGSQLVFTGLGILVEMLLNHFGLTAEMGTEAAQAGTSTLSMFIYAGFLGPIAEELVFRGFLMRSLEKHGKVLAIVFTSVLFGLMHTNLVQTIFAAVIGLVLGYTAMEYGIGWSITLHILNNFLFGDMLSKLEDHIPETAANILEYSLLGAFTLLGGYFLVVYRKKILSYIAEHRSLPKTALWVYTAVCSIVFIAITLVLTASIIQKMA